MSEQPKTKHHWSRQKKAAAHIVDQHRGELADLLLSLRAVPTADTELGMATWHIPDQLHLDIVYLSDVAFGDPALMALEDEIQAAINHYLAAQQ